MKLCRKELIIGYQIEFAMEYCSTSENKKKINKKKSHEALLKIDMQS